MFGFRVDANLSVHQLLITPNQLDDLSQSRYFKHAVKERVVGTNIWYPFNCPQLFDFRQGKILAEPALNLNPIYLLGGFV